MIKIGQKIILSYAGSRTRWHLKIIGDPHIFYQYWPKSNNLLHAVSHPLRPYYREQIDPADKNKYSKRIISFVVDIYDQDLKLFSFPQSIINQITDEFGIGAIKANDWEITKTGTGLNTRYHIKKIKEILELSQEDENIIEDTIEKISVRSIILNRVEKYTLKKNTPFTRFQIMDI